MLSKNQIKLINALKIKKFREQYCLFVIEGTKAVAEILQSSYTIRSIYGKKTWFERNNYILSERKELQHNIFIISDTEMTKISSFTTPNEVLLIAEIPENKFNVQDLEDELVLMLDEVKDPGNLGTIIRVADWFGIKNIVCSTNSVDAFNPKVVQSTMGSITRVKVYYEELLAVLKTNKQKSELPVFGALLNGENIYKAEFQTKGIILLGNESKGISAELLPFITRKITIPSYGGAESLNVSIAAAIICSEFRRNQD